MTLLVGTVLAARFYDARWYLRRRTRLLVAVRLIFTIGISAMLTLSATGKQLSAPFTRGDGPRLNGIVYTLCLATRILLMRVDFLSALMLQALDCAAMGVAFRVAGWPAAAAEASPGLFWSAMITLYLFLPSALTSAFDAWQDRRATAVVAVATPLAAALGRTGSGSLQPGAKAPAPAGCGAGRKSRRAAGGA